ncbi:hypothetical protein ACT7CU_14575 [Bacillus paranthracis]
MQLQWVDHKSFLEPGEEMTVNEMLKGIAIASGNDASVAVAEHIAGSEEGFVNMMNKKSERFRTEKYSFSKSDRSSG